MNEHSEIDAVEDRLIAAQIAHDIEELDALLHDELTYTDPTGASGRKQADLQAHRDRAYDLTRFEVVARAYDDVADGVVVARVTMLAESTLGGGTMHYTRVWVRDGAGWRVRAAHLHMT